MVLYFIGYFCVMTDIIRLLPDSVANQIAAGEVVQRPASVVKELLENTIDAGATDIKLIIRDSGKLLIQVTDNGCGMSERDARMCFERHATSKIQKADDLLSIRTMGFRGEALASIASIAHVEVKTKRHEDEVGTSVIIEGTEFKGQSPVSCANGTTISVKNLFFNVPARRNFLKSNTLELKYIIEAFFRVALVNPDIVFTFFNQDKTLFHLPAGNLKQRIINLYGASYGQRLIPVEQQSELVNISGFIGKPEFAKKSRGEQFFFTNGRFMKSPFLHFSVDSAFKELIPNDAVPSYFLYLEVDPQTIDVNIHPTKTEINFQDIKSIYAILHASVKQAIGKFSLSPSLDFDTEQSMNVPIFPADRPIRPPVITVNPNFNPFEKKIQPQTSFTFPQKPSPPIQGWQDLYETRPPSVEKIQFPAATHEPSGEPASGANNGIAKDRTRGVQVQQSYILTHTRSGVIVLDQQHAHERVLYERFLEEHKTGTNQGQHQLIPQTITLSPDDAQMMAEWSDYFKQLGFEINDFGKGTFVVHAMPVSLENTDIRMFIESVLESLKSPGQDYKTENIQLLAKAMAKKLSIKRGKILHQEEVDALIENLFACKAPGVSPEGKPTMFVISYEELNTKFRI
jgi:DNA mismatch repair protein MutL